MANILVTGGNGYIGSRLLERLANNYSSGLLFAVTREGSDNLHLPENRRITPVEYDGTVESLLDGVDKCDHVIHLGALYSTKKDDETLDALIQSNITFSLHLLQAITRVNPKVTFTSTSTFSAFDSEYNYAPQSVYAATKTAVEILAEAFPVRATFLRLPDTYGPGDWRPKVHNLLKRAVQSHDVSFSFGKPEHQVLNLAHVDDVLTALVHAAVLRRHTNPGVDIYDLFYPENNITLGEIADLVIKGSDTAVSFPLFGETSELPEMKYPLPDFSIEHEVRESLRSALFGEGN